MCSPQRPFVLNARFLRANILSRSDCWYYCVGSWFVPYIWDKVTILFETSKEWAFLFAKVLSSNQTVQKVDVPENDLPHPLLNDTCHKWTSFQTSWKAKFLGHARQPLQPMVFPTVCLRAGSFAKGMCLQHREPTHAMRRWRLMTFFILWSCLAPPTHNTKQLCAVGTHNKQQH